MMTSVTQMGQSIAQIGRRVQRLLKRNFFWFGLTAILAMAFLLIVLIRHNSAPYRIVMLTGPAGGGGERLGRKLAQRIAPPGMWDLWQKRFQLVTEPSHGFEDNRQRVDRDTQGYVIGFAHDGFNPTENVQILLPLEESYVHIIASAELYEAALQLEPRFRSEAEDGKRRFHHLVPLLKQAGGKASQGDGFRMAYRAFLGPRLSGTRQTAELILQHYGVPVAPIDSQFEYDWEGMFVALTEGRIHLAFFTTEPGVGVVRKLARRGGFYLVGLDDAQGIAATYPFVRLRSFPPNTYGRNGFCGAETQTIATRRVIVCSRQLDRENGYWLSMQLARAIREEVPTIRWNNATADPSAGGDFTYPLHASATLFANAQTPWYAYVPSPFWPLIITVAVGSLAFGLKKVAGEGAPEPSRSRPTERAAGGEMEPSRNRLTDEVAAAIAALVPVDGPLTAREHRRWQRKALEFRRRLVEEARTSAITEREKESVAHGIGELLIELEMLRPPPRSGTRKRRVPGGGRPPAVT